MGLLEVTGENLITGIITREVEKNVISDKILIRQMNINNVIKCIEEHFGTPLSSIRKKSNNLVIVRKWASWALCDLVGLSLHEAAVIIGRDHSNIIHHRDDLRDKFDIYKDVRELKIKIEKIVIPHEENKNKL